MSLGGVSERLRRVFRAGQVCSGGSDWLARLEPFHPLPPNLTLSNIHGPPLILSLFPSSLPCIGGDSPTSQSLLERCPLLLGTPFLLPCLILPQSSFSTSSGVCGASPHPAQRLAQFRCSWVLISGGRMLSRVVTRAEAVL